MANKEGMKVRRWILFLLLLFVFLVLLQVLDWVPEALEYSSLRQFRSLEQLHQVHPESHLYLPRYFPMRLDWPPAEILAQSRPYFLMLLHVRDRERGRITLAIRQAEAVADGVPELRIRAALVQSEEEIDLRGRPAVLRRARCEDGSTCNQISWTEGRYQMTVVARESAEELLRIAESMLP